MKRLYCICTSKRAFKRAIKTCDSEDIEIREIVQYADDAYGLTLCVSASYCQRIINALRSKGGGIVFYGGAQ
jgi:hypothetical protein